MCENCKNNCDCHKENIPFENIVVDDNRLYVDIKNKTVVIKADEEGIVVDIFENEIDEFMEPVVSTWCLYNE